MSPVSLPAALVHVFVPNFDGPTAWLLSHASSCALNRNSVTQRIFLSRLACIAAVATAAFEMVVHTALLAVTIPMVILKRYIWIALITSSYIMGGLFGLIHGDAFRLGWEVWIKRILIHIGLFLRHPVVVCDHLMVWRGLMWRHSVLIVQITSLAWRIECSLSQYFSSKHVIHHAWQAFHLFRYTLIGIPDGLRNPGRTAKWGIDAGIGPTKQLSLLTRTWNRVPSPYPVIGKILARSLTLIGDHWDKILLLTLYGMYRDYYHKTPSFHITDLPDGIFNLLRKIVGGTWEIFISRPLTPEEFLERVKDAMEKRMKL